MNVQVISDLHLEFQDLTLPGGDVLILSGDVCEAKNIKSANYEKNAVQFEFERKRSDRYIRFFVEECAKYRHVIYVMGNHEHYHFVYDETYQHIKNQLPNNIYLLENETKEIDDVVFLGATLWTDANNNNPITGYTLQSGMNDYRVVQKKIGPEQNYYGRLSVQATVYIHNQSKKWLDQTLEKYADRKCVVVTHHAPSERSVSSEYKTEQHMNGGYFSKLDDFILDRPQIRVWTHGHTHNRFDYMIGTTRILCNPRGYVGYEKSAETFDPTVGFEL